MEHLCPLSLRLLNGLLIHKGDSHPVPIIVSVQIALQIPNKASLPENLSTSPSASGSPRYQWLLEGRGGINYTEKL